MDRKRSPRAADAVIERILVSAERLGRFPYIGHPGRAPGTYEWVIPGLPYILVYQVRHDDELVMVMAVFDGAQNR
jgi:toxin ParE1/3/4